MSAVTPRLYYAPVTLYAREETEVFRCEVISFVTNEALYRQVTRVADQAYQILKGDEVYSNPLYENADCTIPASIYISDKWISELGQEGADHGLP